uniref:Uncharacterized protein n=1 Tax=Arundo donax TaxID=35708 RepID=A0A0A8YVR4_ARUDO
MPSPCLTPRTRFCPLL